MCARIVGQGRFEKGIDVLTTAIKAGMTVFDLEELETYGSIEVSLHILPDDYRKRLLELDRDKFYIFYWALGFRG